MFKKEYGTGFPAPHLFINKILFLLSQPPLPTCAHLLTNGFKKN